MSDFKIGIYRHNKTGNLYKVIGLGQHSETDDELVIYEPLEQYSELNKPGKHWLRPKKMFLEIVNINNKIMPRFEFLKK